jgi:WD40 repeat protein/tetratricopeptide (TPR) repeat protein
VLALLLTTLAIGASVAAFHFGRMADTEKGLRIEAQDARQDAEQAKEAALDSEAKSRQTLVEISTSYGLVSAERNDSGQGVLWFAHAARLAGSGTEQEQANRARVTTWSRQAFQPVRALPHNETPLRSLAFHPKGQYLLTHAGRFRANTGVPYEEECTLWDLGKEAPSAWPVGITKVSSAAWSPDGRRLAVGTPEGAVVLGAFPAGAEIRRIPYGGTIHQLLFSPDGHYLAIASANTARVWDCQAKAFATPELEHPGPVITLAFHPRGQRLATGCLDHKARVFAVPMATEGPLFPPVPHHQRIGDYRSGPIAPAFVDEGRGLLTVPDHPTGSDRRLIWRDAESGTVVHFISPPAKQGVYGVCAVAVSPDSRIFAVGHFGVTQIWEVARGEKGGRPLLRSRERQVTGEVDAVVVAADAVVAAAFSPDGRTLLIGSRDRTVQRWSVPDGKALGGPLTHPTGVNLVAFSPDGRLLATAQGGGLVRIWAAPTDNPCDSSLPLDGAVSNGKCSPDGRFVLPTGSTNRNCSLHSTQVYEVATGQPAGPSLIGGGIILDAAFSPDAGQVAALVSLAGSYRDRQSRRNHVTNIQPGQLKLWDWRTGQLTCAPLTTPSEPRSLDYSPEGQRLAVLCAGGQVLMIHPVTGQILKQWQADAYTGNGNGVWNNGMLRFSPDGQSLMTFGTNSVVRVWEAVSGQERYAALTHGKKCYDAQFSADGRLLVTASEDRSVRVWDVATGQPLANSLLHPSGVITAVFSRDGTQVLTGCSDHMARLWDWQAGRLVCPALEHESTIISGAFHPNGRWVLTVSENGVFRVWDGQTGKPVTPPLPTGNGSGISLAVTPDGNYAVVGGWAARYDRWTALQVFYFGDLSDAASDLDDLCTWGELLSGRRVHDGSGVTNLTAEEWLTRWREYRQRHPGPDRIEPADPLSYHWREARANEAAQQWSAAIPYLDRLIAAHPTVGPLYARRGVAHAELEQWEKALADFTRASELRPDDVLAIGSSRARLCLAAGDEAVYRRVCADLLQRFGMGASIANARETVWTSALRPDAVPDPSQLVRIAVRVVAQEPKGAIYLRSLGAALYRAGRFEEAIQQLNAAIAAQNGDGLFEDWLFLAMAHHRLGHAAEARQWLDKTIQWEAKRKDDAEPLDWVARWELQILLHEAKELIEGKAKEPKK